MNLDWDINDVPVVLTGIDYDHDEYQASFDAVLVGGVDITPILTSQQLDRLAGDVYAAEAIRSAAEAADNAAEDAYERRLQAMEPI